MKLTLNLTVLKDIHSSGMLIGLASDIGNRLEALPAMKEFHERAQAALILLCKAHRGEEIRSHEARIRAGLNECKSSPHPVWTEARRLR
jgi:hypothetical protein